MSENTAVTLFVIILKISFIGLIFLILNTILNFIFPEQIACSHTTNQCKVGTIFATNSTYQLDDIEYSYCSTSIHSRIRGGSYYATYFGLKTKNENIFGSYKNTLFETANCDKKLVSFNQYLKSDKDKIKIKRSLKWSDFVLFFASCIFSLLIGNLLLKVFGK